MNIVAIDPSLTCTAMVVNGKAFVYTTESVALTKKLELKRWFKETEGLVTVRTFPDASGDSDDHSLSEIQKLHRYQTIVAEIIKDIRSHLFADNLTVAIEGYSYSSAAGPLIDLVTFGTLLRRAVSEINLTGWASLGEDMMFRYTTVRILQPTTVKQRAAMLVYPPITKGKKVEYRNNEGVAGGSFKKPEIYKALIENTKLTFDPWVVFLNEHAEEIMAMKSIPKPIEDVNDAKTIYEILKTEINSDK